jgi:hypothetical protein
MCLKGERGDYESDSFYFNTFIMVEQTTETIIQLRSTEKQNYSKKSVVFEEGLLLKTKLISLKNSLKLINNSDFNLCLRVKEQSSDPSHELFLNSKETKLSCLRLRGDTPLEVVLMN